MKLIPFLILFFITSCSQYVNNLHRQLDREEKVTTDRKHHHNGDMRDRFAAYREKDRFNRANDKRPINNPVTYSLGSDPGGTMKPPVKREYRPQRYQADDFKDEGDNTGSLWANQGNSASLFTYQNDKHMGDIVIINVLENLRNDISAELKRTFPDRPKRTGKELKEPAEDKKAAQAPAPSPMGTDNDIDMKVYDKISGTVLEEVSKDYILLRGRKEVIFKKEKRSIEVQALVSRKDIMENDYVNSDKLLESRVYVLGKDD
jgi:flagellar L-ring protein precursor FlgH